MKPRSSSLLALALWLLTVSLLAAGLVFYFLTRSTAIPKGSDPTITGPAFALVMLAVFSAGAYIAYRRPSNAIGWILCIAPAAFAAGGLGSGYAVYGSLVRPGSLPRPDIAAWASSLTTFPAILSLLLLFLLFPNGKVPSRRWRPMLWVILAGLAISVVGTAFETGPFDDIRFLRNPFGLPWKGFEAMAGSGWAVWILGSLFCASSLVFRYRASGREERQQIKWFASAAVVLALSFILNGFGYGSNNRFILNLAIGISALGFVGMAVAIAVAVLKYRLYEIDVIINKAVVYGILAFLLTGLYFALVVGVGAGAAAGTGYNPSLSVMATAIVAFVFQPLRTRLQRLANRMVYGKRATPYEAMAGFSQQMAGSLSLEEVLPRMAEAAARGIAATGTRVRVFLPGGAERAASWPPGSADGVYERTVAVIHQGETLGEIAVAKAPNDPITPAEEKLLEDLASQAGPAMRNVRLTEDLRASRARIVAAQDEERRRIERDIHDGAQQQLVSMAVKLGIVGSLLSKDPEKAEKVVEELKGEAGAAVETLRDLARGVFPRLLADKGLVAALEAHLAKMDLGGAKLWSSLPDGARFDLQIEGAIYFCIREALQNAYKHAPGAPVTVALSQTEDLLEFSVRDEGPGFDVAAAKRGSGLQNMADRIEALGGTFETQSMPGRGTRITGRIPALETT